MSCGIPCLSTVQRALNRLLQTFTFQITRDDLAFGVDQKRRGESIHAELPGCLSQFSPTQQRLCPLVTFGFDLFLNFLGSVPQIDPHESLRARWTKIKAAGAGTEKARK